MIVLDLWGYIGYLFICAGLVFISKKHRVGWWFRFIGNVIWTGIGLASGMTSLWVFGFIFCAMDLYGGYKWRK